jgi:hypothetical protein
MTQQPGGRTSNTLAARVQNQLVQSYTGASQTIVLDARGMTDLTVGWAAGSSAIDIARVGRALSSTSTAHMSTSPWDLMTVTGTSGGEVTSTGIDWPWIIITTDASGSTTATLYVALSGR